MLVTSTRKDFINFSSEGKGNVPSVGSNEGREVGSFEGRDVGSKRKNYN